MLSLLTEQASVHTFFNFISILPQGHKTYTDPDPYKKEHEKSVYLI